MDTLFLLCAIVGGTILLLQFAMMMLGLGGDGADGSDVGGHGGGDFAGDGGLDTGGHDPSFDTGESFEAHHDHPHEHSTIWFFKVLTFQTFVAALAFFGLGGKIALSADIDPMPSVFIAIAAGIAAMYGVYYLMRGLHKFNADGTLQINRAVGLPGTVYVPIPGSNAGAGKIQMNLQNRIVEFQAMTRSDRLPSGAKIRVVGILGPDTVAVEPLIESETHSHA